MYFVIEMNRQKSNIEKWKKFKLKSFNDQMV